MLFSLAVGTAFVGVVCRAVSVLAHKDGVVIALILVDEVQTKF